MPSWYTERVRINGLTTGSCSFCGMSLAMRSPSEMETWVAMREENPGFRDRARLQNGVWLQFLNSSLFQDETDELLRKRRR